MSLETFLISVSVTVVGGLVLFVLQKVFERRLLAKDKNVENEYNRRISGISQWEKLLIRVVYARGLKNYFRSYKARVLGKLMDQSGLGQVADLFVSPTSLRLVDTITSTKRSLETYSVLDSIKAYSHTGVVILGESGAGKSTSLKQVVRKYCEADRPAPLLVELRNYQRPDSLELLMAQEIGNRLWLERGLKLGRFLILLDGVNEIPQEAVRAFQNDLLLLKAEYPDNGFVITCRPADYLDYFPSFAHFRLQPLSQDSITHFLRLTLGEDEGKKLIDSLDERLIGFSENPYLLTMLAKTYQTSGTLPLNRAKLYEKFLNQFLLGEATKSKAEISINIKHDILSDLAFYMGNQSVSVDIALVQRIIGKKLIELRKSFEHEYQTSDVLDETLSNGLLRLEFGNISFMHQSVQEFYTAHELLERVTSGVMKIEQIGDYVDDVRWRETLRTLAGLFSDATPMIEVIRPKDLTLASECIYASSYVSPTLVDRCIVQAVTEFKFGVEPFNYHLIFSLKRIGNRRSENLSQRVIDDMTYWCEKFASTTPRALIGVDTRNLLMAMTDSNNSHFLPDVIWTLGLRKEVRAVNHLVDILLNRNSPFRADAARALGAIKDKRATAALLSCIKDDALNLRPHIFMALGAIADSSAVPALIEYLGNINSPYRENACWALLGVVNETIHDFLIANIYKGTRYARANFVYLLGQYTVPKGLKPLIELMRVEHDPYVREDIAFALGEYRNKEAVPSLISQLKNDDALVRTRVVESLGKIGDSLALEPLRLLLETDDSVFVQDSIRVAIANIQKLAN